MNIIIESIKKCYFFHKWKILKDTGYTVYRECEKCKARQILQPPAGGYQAVNWDWVYGKVDKI